VSRLCGHTTRRNQAAGRVGLVPWTPGASRTCAEIGGICAVATVAADRGMVHGSGWLRQILWAAPPPEAPVVRTSGGVVACGPRARRPGGTLESISDSGSGHGCAGGCWRSWGGTTLLVMPDCSSFGRGRHAHLSRTASLNLNFPWTGGDAVCMSEAAIHFSGRAVRYALTGLS